MPRQIKVTPVTEEAFKKFGKAIMLRPSHPPLDDNEALTAWIDIKEFPGEPRMTILLTEKKRPMSVTQLERHVGSDEWWTVIDGYGVAVFCEGRKPMDPNDEPDPDKLVAFNMKGVAAYVTAAGVWHWPTFPITETATQIVDVKQGTIETDIEIKPLPEEVQIFL